MTDGIAYWEAEHLDDPVAGLIVQIAGRGIDSLTDAELDQLAEDVAKLRLAAEGRMLPDPLPKQTIKAVADLRKALADAARAADMLPELVADQVRYSGRGVGIREAIENAQEVLGPKLALAGRIGRGELERHPVKRGEKRNVAARQVARLAVLIFERWAADHAKARKLSDRTPANRSSGFVADVFKALGIEAQWYEPMQNAVTEIHGGK